MRAKKYRVGGLAPDGMQQDPNSTGARKGPRQTNAVRQDPVMEENMERLHSTFRDPEHGAKSQSMAADVQRKPTGTTAMGDPFTADQGIFGTPGQSLSIAGENPFVSDGLAEAGAEGDIQEGEQGMMFTAEKGAMVPHDPMSAFESGADMPGEVSHGDRKPQPSRKPKFEEGGFNVMDPRDFLTMLRDERKAKAPRKNK